MALPRIMVQHKSSALRVAFLATITAVLTAGSTCPPTTTTDTADTFTTDTTVASLSIAAGDTTTVENNAEITVTGDATIDGTLSAATGRITLIVDGDLEINGTIRANDSTITDLPGDTALSDQIAGIHIIIGTGTVTFGESAVLETTGHLVVTDDADVLMSTPNDLFDEVEDVSGDEFATLVPLPPDNDAFTDNGAAKTVRRQPRQGAAAGPITITGTWPPVGAPPIPGDVPVWIFRFFGNRDVNLTDWAVNGPAAPGGEDADETNDPGTNATGKSGKNGMRLNIWNAGGPINIDNVVLNLTNGGAGGEASGSCSSATGGDGGKSGNFRMTASGGININGSLTINPGSGGCGGDATVTGGPAGADGCPGADGEDAEATGGAGADNKKRIYVRGNVTGVANIIIGPLFGGDGGAAEAEGCDGGNGIACCDGGNGGKGTATGGKGGDASLNISGFALTSGAVLGGTGGEATSGGGTGGNGGPCKFGDGGDGGDGGDAGATGGTGGDASTTGAGGDTGGSGGNATATGGDGGNGGDSTFGTPGSGGAGGGSTGTAGAGGSATQAGAPGEVDADDGTDGADGVLDGAFTLLCCPLPSFVQDDPGEIEPGTRDGPVLDRNGTTQLGTITIEFVAGETVNYQRGVEPDHIGIGNGMLDIHLSSLQLEQAPGEIGGLRIEPIQGFGIDEANPLIVQALGADGEVLGTERFGTIPDNFGATGESQTIDALFGDGLAIETFRIIAPDGTFITIIQVYLLDP